MPVASALPSCWMANDLHPVSVQRRISHRHSSCAPGVLQKAIKLKQSTARLVVNAEVGPAQLECEPVAAGLHECLLKAPQLAEGILPLGCGSS